MVTKSSTDMIVQDHNRIKMNCVYGCGRLGKFATPSGDLRCDTHHNKCPAKKKALSKIVEQQWADLSADQKAVNARGLLGGDIAKPENAKHLAKARQTRIDRGHYLTEAQRGPYQQYRYEVRKLTNSNYKKFKDEINPNNHPRNREWHLDHQYSIVDGFLNGVPSDVISHPANLRMIPGRDNQVKNKTSSITLEFLMASINTNSF